VGFGLRRVVLILAIIVVLEGCSRPKPPTITPEKATITSIGPGGIGVVLELGLDNPNSIELAGRAVTAKVVLDGKYDLGTVTAPNGIKLPAGKRTDLSVPMSLPWKDLPTLLALAGQGRDVPYDIDGTLTVGGDTFHADLPFHLTGVLTREQLIQATVNSLPRLPFP
jgi:LEA14-like dessication related protein